MTELLKLVKNDNKRIDSYESFSIIAVPTTVLYYGTHFIFVSALWLLLIYFYWFENKDLLLT